jgi:nucleotide-binding universal stress UspA family protein
VAVDFSTGSHAALLQAVRMAQKSGAKLHILHVLDSAAVAAHAASRDEAYESFVKVSSEGASVAMQKWLEPVPLPPAADVTIVVGTPLHEILEHTKTLNADLLVAGITGSGNAPAGAGSVAGRLARKAACKVLLVRANHAHEFKKIVACVDFSDTAREVVEQARLVAQQDGAAVDFLNIWQEPWTVMPYALPFAETGAAAAVITPEQREQYIASLRRELHEFVADASAGIAAAEVLLEAENFGRGIAAHSSESGADLIVVGAKGKTNLKYVLMGSTAERLLTLLPCSLLVVKPAV